MDREAGKLIGVIFLIVVLVVVAGTIIFLSIQHPERRLDVGANIEDIQIDGNLAKITLSGGANNKEIERVKFIFTDSKGVQHYYFTTEGIENLSKPYKKSIVNLFKEPEFEGIYEYIIDSNEIGFNSFDSIYKVEVVFDYEKEGLGVDKDVSLDSEIINEGSAPSSGGGGSSFTPDSDLIPTLKAYWKYSNSEVIELKDMVYGTSLTLVLENSGLNSGTSVEFIIYEKDWFDDDYMAKVNALVGSDGYVSMEWIIEEAHVDAARNLLEGNKIELYFEVNGVESDVLKIGFEDTGIEPNCSDEIQNQNETDVDCGGECEDCIEDADYYVATWGDDLNNGSFDYPFATWQKAFQIVVAGDLVYIRGGTYEIANDSYGVFVEDRDGTSDNLIRIFNYPGETPILDCTNNLVENEFNYGIDLFNCEYWHLKGLEVTNVLQPNPGSAAGIVSAACGNMIFENLKVHNVGGTGIEVSWSTDTVLVKNCDSYDNYDPEAEIPGGNADGFGGVSAVRTSPTIFEGCRAWNNSDDGFDTWEHEGVVTFNSCWSFSNGFNQGDGSGFKLGRTLEPKLATPQRIIRNSLAFNNKDVGFNQNSGHVDMILYNNIAYWNRGRAGYILDQDNIVTTMRNNIDYNNSGTSYFSINSLHDHNSWDSSVIVDDSDFVSLDWSGMDGPREADGSLPDLDFLKLASGSDLIDAGTNVGLSYQGNAPDIGAFEYSGSDNGGSGNGDGSPQYINVKDYGAVGDGVTDDIIAINNALAIAEGKILYFPAGTYVISNTITASVNNVTIKGTGLDSSIISLEDGVNDSLVVIGGFNWTIKDLRFDGNNYTRRGISIPVYSEDVHIQGIMIENLSGYDEQESSVNGSYGIRIDDESKNIGIYDTTIRNIHGGSDGIIGNARGANRGIYIRKVYNVIIDNCSFDEIGDFEDGDAIHVQVPDDGPSDVTIKNSKFTNVYKRAIKLQSSNAIVQNNYIQSNYVGDNAQSPFIGINTWGEGHIIFNNSIYFLRATTGITSKSVKINISYNFIENDIAHAFENSRGGWTLAGIQLIDATDVNIIGNTIKSHKLGLVTYAYVVNSTITGNIFSHSNRPISDAILNEPSNVVSNNTFL